MANQLGMVFAKLDCKPRWRERLSELAIPALVVHGRRDPFFPVGNGEALAREIPGARLLVLERAATAIPDADADEVAAAMLALSEENDGFAAEDDRRVVIGRLRGHAEQCTRPVSRSGARCPAGTTTSSPGPSCSLLLDRHR